MRAWNCGRRRGKGAAWFQISPVSSDTSSSHVRTHTHIYTQHTSVHIYIYTKNIYIYICVRVSYICLYIFHSGEVTPWFTIVIHEVVVWK